MRHVLLLLLFSIVLTGCDDYTGQKSYDEALRCIKEGDAPQALAYLREAADNARDDSLLAAIYNDLGQLLFDEGLQEQALAAWLKAYDSNRSLHDTLDMAACLFDVANVYRTREDDDSCLYYFNEAQHLASIKGDTMLMADIQSQKAGYYLWHHDYEKAKQLLLPLLQDAGCSSYGGIRFMAADLYRQTGPADSATYYCSLLLQEEETGLRQMAHKWLAEQLLNEGRASEAYSHLEKYELLTDSIMQETDTESLHRVNALYDYTNREQENRRLEQRIIIVASVTILLVLLMIILLLYSSRRRMEYRMKLQRLEHLLEDYRSHSDISSERQNQILEESPICQHISRLLSDSRQPSMSDEDWHILEDTIGKAQPRFLKQLREFYRFSPHEMHVCLLLRLGISPAAIAQLTAHSKQSISSVRSRLFEKVFGKKGSPSQWDEFIVSL